MTADAPAVAAFRTSTRPRRPSPWPAQIALLAIGVQGGAAVALGFLAQPFTDWADPGTSITAVSRVMAMAGTFLALLSLLLIARLPWLERELGQDRLVKWHRFVGPYSLYLILGHVVLVSAGYSILGDTNTWQQFWLLVLDSPWMMPALAGFIFMMMVGVTSYKRARSRMRYDTWWLLHLYAYLGVSLAFMHQIDSGVMFADHPGLRNWWIGLYATVFGIIVFFRVVEPLRKSIRHDLKVERVVRETKDTYSVVIHGRDIAALGAQGGQFFGFRFIDGKHWWESHPYSLSAAPRNNRLRITVKRLGDASAALARVKPGTRVWVEGPYGVFTADRVETDRVVLFGGGVGITPIRAILEELPADTEIDLVWRASNSDELPLKEEIEKLMQQRQGRLHKLIGSRKRHPLAPADIRRLVPDIATAEIYLCGPDGLVDSILDSLRELGVPSERIHAEAFAY